ncbi:MAG: hypothetical protein AAGC53_16050 [Actinomycetota bacterium]
MAESTSTTDKKGVGDVFDMVKAYARQETLDPLKGAGQWIGFGLAGSVLMIIGGISLTLALLRFIQEEGPSWTTGQLTWLPYLMTLLAVTIFMIVPVVLRLRKKTL